VKKPLGDGRIAVLYAVAFVIVAVAAVIASAWVMDLTHRGGQGSPSGIEGWILNVVPSLAVGLAGYFGLARALLPAGMPWSRGRHLRRSAALYGVVVLFGVLMVHDGSNPDFWRFGQLVLWPWVTALGGILGDGLAAARQQRRTAHDGGRP
jgi:hypothetical protein